MEHFACSSNYYIENTHYWLEDLFGEKTISAPAHCSDSFLRQPFELESLERR